MQRTTSRDSLFSITSDAPCSETFHVGDQCKIDENRVGTVAFVGNTKFASGVWVGLTLEKPEGKNDGAVGPDRYFQCAPKHGVFCRPSKLTKLGPSSPLSPSLSNGPPSPALSYAARSIASTTVATNKTRSIYARECGFDIGERVNIGAGKVGVLKFLDRINGELFAGVQLDRPLGCCDGAYKGERYFKCNPLYGIFVKASTVKKCAKIAKPAAIEVRPTKASTLRTWKGSQESLNSAGGLSLCSAMSPRFGSKISSASHSKDGEIVASLKNCLQEKEAHLERLTKELEQRRAESENLTQENSELASRLMELDQIVSNSNSECTDLTNKLQDLESQCEELNFQLDEAQVHRSVFEAENIELKSQCIELKDQLKASTNELLFQQSEFIQEKVEIVDQHVQTDARILTVTATQTIYATSDMSNDVFYSKSFNEVAVQAVTEEVPRTVSSTQTETEKATETQSTGIQTVTPDERKFTDAECQSTASTSSCVEVQTENFVEARPESLDASSQTNVQLKSTDVQTDTRTSPALANSSAQTQEVPAKELSSAEIQTQLDTCHMFSQTNIISMIEQNIQTDRLQSEHFGTQTEKAKPKELISQNIQTILIDTQHFASQTASALLSSNSTQTEVNEKAISATVQSQTDSAVMCVAQIQTEQSGFVTDTPKKVVKVSVQTSPLSQLYEHTAMQTIPIDTDSVQPNVVELSVPKLAVTSQSGRSNEIEVILKEHNEKVEQLDSTVSFLNSIISEQNTTIGKLRDELSVRLEGSSLPAKNAAPVNGVGAADMRKRVRLYCDNCEVFDIHDTSSCPKEMEKRAESLTHFTTSPSSLKCGKGTQRPFCDRCDSFEHETKECPFNINRGSKIVPKAATSPVTKW